MEFDSLETGIGFELFYEPVGEERFTRRLRISRKVYKKRKASIKDIHIPVQ